MSDWIADLKASEKRAADAAAIQAELALYGERRFGELIDDWWDAFQSQLESDAARLEKSIRTKRTNTPSIQLERFGSRGAYVSAQLRRDARQIKIAYSHSDHGITYKHDDLEKLMLQMIGDRISVVGHADLSRHLLMRLLEESEKR